MFATVLADRGVTCHLRRTGVNGDDQPLVSSNHAVKSHLFLEMPPALVPWQSEQTRKLFATSIDSLGTFILGCRFIFDIRRTPDSQ